MKTRELKLNKVQINNLNKANSTKQPQTVAGCGENPGGGAIHVITDVITTIIHG
ncbi:MAG: hypothetical protein ACEPOV_11440 [Hyphomicrobiales bacterium]